MSNIELNPQELTLLREVLGRDINEVDIEISRADSIDFKHMLKQRKEHLEHILHKVEAEPAPVVM